MSFKSLQRQCFKKAHLGMLHISSYIGPKCYQLLEVPLMQPKIGILLSFPQNYPKLSKYPNIRQKSYISHFHKITISCLRYPWSNLEQVSYDHFTKITISCPNIQISAKNHTLIIFTKLPSAARGTPGAPQNRYYMINFPKITISCPNIQISAKNHTLIIFKNCHQLPEVPLVHPRIGII